MSAFEGFDIRCSYHFLTQRADHSHNVIWSFELEIARRSFLYTLNFLFETGDPDAVSIIAKGTKTARTSRRQRIPRLLRNRTSQTRRKRRTPTHRRHLASIRNHAARLRRQILKLCCTLAAGESVIVIRQIDNRDLARVVASKERGPLVQTLTEECCCGRYDGHLGQACELRLHIRLIQFAAVGKIAACVGGVVVYQDDADAASGFEEGKERIILMGFAAIDEGEFGLCLHEGGMGILVKWVGIGCVLIHERQGMRLCYNGG